ncbi:MAG TPA: hypothetical protein VJN95_12940 [Gemmatimonadales bacterium]|nr:hypothetical protein [Gemmatimonadales bacterium]
MSIRPWAGLLFLLSCGGVHYVTLTASPAGAPPDVFECVKSELGKAKFQQTSIDLGSPLRITAKQSDYSKQVANARYYRNSDRIEAEVAPGADGKATLKVVGHTFSESETVRGPTDTEEEASANVKQVVQTIIQACGQ